MIDKALELPVRAARLPAAWQQEGRAWAFTCSSPQAWSDRSMWLIGMLLIVTVNVTAQANEAPLRLTEFAHEGEAVRWQIVNDTVMGGRSSSQFSIQDGLLRFSGVLNTNGGGFASLRSSRLPDHRPTHSLVRIRVLGDGRVYQFRMFVDGDRASYQSEFRTVQNTWQVIELPVSQFTASWRGRRLQRPPLALPDVVGIGIILADGRDGDFSLALDWIEFDQAVQQAGS